MRSKPPSADVHETFTMGGSLPVPLPSLLLLLLLLLLLVLVPAGHAMPGCNEELQLGTSGEMFLESPSHPSPYPGNFTCWWRLRAPPGFRVYLRSLTFDTGNDTLTVYDGENTSAQEKTRTQGTRGIWGVRSSSRDLYLLFKTGTVSANSTGFRLSSHAYPDDFKEVNTEIFVPNSTYQVLKSPNYPENYPRNFECWWLLRAPPGETLKLSSLTFRVPCNNGSDHLIIHDGNNTSAPVLEEICGDRSFVRVKSTGSSLYVRFQSGPDGEDGQGFRLEFRAITDTFECRFENEVIDLNGTEVMYLTSPRYPLNYYTTDQCGVTFQATLQDYVIKMEAVEFEMPGSEPNCSIDILVFMNGFGSERRRSEWCGSGPSTPLYSRYGDSTMYFALREKQRSPRQVGKFKLRFQQVPSNHTPEGTTGGPVVSTPDSIPDSTPDSSTNSSTNSTIERTLVSSVSNLQTRIIVAAACGALLLLTIIVGVVGFLLVLWRRASKTRQLDGQGTADGVHFSSIEPPSPAPRASEASPPVQEREGGTVQGFHPPVGSRAAYNGMGHSHLYSLYPPYQEVDPPPTPPVATAPPVALRGDNSAELTPEAPLPSDCTC